MTISTKTYIAVVKPNIIYSYIKKNTVMYLLAVCEVF